MGGEAGGRKIRQTVEAARNHFRAAFFMAVYIQRKMFVHHV
jgi:hypothetical protein